MRRKAVHLLCLLLIVVPLQQAQRPPVISEVVVCSRDGRTEKVVYSAPQRIESPEWSRDGKSLIWASEGRLWRWALAGGNPQAIATGALSRIGTHHRLSPDGARVAFSAGEIYTVPVEGGPVSRVLWRSPSFVYNWSPDGRMLLFSARRNNNFDLFAVPAAGGEEKRLTASFAFDDCPDYSADGQFIYFTSDRGVGWDIWRMPASGNGALDERAERITGDEREDWFPHPSPDGRWLLFVSYAAGIIGHPRMQQVELRLMDLRSKRAAPQTIKRLTGGEGTLNVNSWSADSRQFAYVRYRQ